MNGEFLFDNLKYKISKLGPQLVISKKKWTISYEWRIDQSTEKIQYHIIAPEFKVLKTFEFSEIEELIYEVIPVLLDLPDVEVPEHMDDTVRGRYHYDRKVTVKLVLKNGKKVKIFFGTPSDGLRVGKIISKFLKIPFIWIRDVKKVAFFLNGIWGSPIATGISLMLGSLLLSPIELQLCFYFIGLIFVLVCGPALAAADYSLFKLNKKREWHTRELINFE